MALEDRGPVQRCENCTFWTQFDLNKFLGVCEHPERKREATDRFETCSKHQFPGP